MSFARTGTGARFIAAWQVHAPSLEVQLSHHYPGLIPFDEFTVTDDKRARYQLDHTPGSDLAWPNMIRLSPAPPGNIRWLDVAPPYRQAVRVDLSQARCDQALAARLPELDGIRLILLGLQHTEGGSALHVLAQGRTPEPRPGPLDIDLNFPLSLWLRDSGGRWHAARPDRCHQGDRESAIRLRLVPPLTRPADRVEVLAGGRSAQVRATLPLRWRYPS